MSDGLPGALGPCLSEIVEGIVDGGSSLEVNSCDGFELMLDSEVSPRACAENLVGGGI